MKKFICILISLILICGIIIPTSYALDVDAIEPDGDVFIIGITDQDIPIAGTLPHCDAGPGTTIVLPLVPLTDWLYINPVTGTIIDYSGENKDKDNNNTTNNNDSNEDKKEEESPVSDESVIPKDNEQAISYQMNNDKVIQEIFELTNQARISNGLSELTYNKEIQNAADTRAKEISTLFSHTRPNGKSCHSVVEGLDYYVTGENIIMADNPISNPQTLMDTWMNSEGHRANILLPEYTSIAIGLYTKDDITYAVQIFMG